MITRAWSYQGGGLKDRQFVPPPELVAITMTSNKETFLQNYKKILKKCFSTPEL